MADVMVPDQVIAGETSYGVSSDPHAVIRAKLTPCPLCGANAHEGPEGEKWVPLGHCWQCGFRPDKPFQAAPHTAAPPALAPAQVQALAAAVVAQMRSEGWTPPPAALVESETS